MPDYRRKHWDLRVFGCCSQERQVLYSRCRVRVIWVRGRRWGLLRIKMDRFKLLTRQRQELRGGFIGRCCREIVNGEITESGPGKSGFRTRLGQKWRFEQP